MATPEKKYSISQTHGITEKKNAELNLLQIQVLNAQNDVDVFNAIFSSLTVREIKFSEFLTSAESERNKALSNKNLMDELIESTLELKNNFNTDLEETKRVVSKGKVIAKDVKQLLEKLIYAANLMNRLSNLVLRKKVLDPLISDDLVGNINTAINDANSAVALALVALKSAFLAQESIIESEAIMEPMYLKSLVLYQTMTESNVEDNGMKNSSLYEMLNNAYINANKYYEQMLEAFTLTSNQLKNAQTDLYNAQIKLRSLQAAFAAGNAASLAS